MIFDFNSGWTFQKQDGETSIVNLPHDAMLTEKRYAKSSNAAQSGFFPGGKYIYKRNFYITGNDIGKYIGLLFEGVYQNTTILINGKKAAFHKYGYTEFTVDISDLVHEGENQVEALVDNSLVPNCRWYSGSGIYRPVTLIIREKVRITDIFIKTLSCMPAVISAAVETTDDVPLTVEIFGGDSLIASGRAGVFEIKNAKLWDADEPYLYSCLVSCETDSVKVSFGIRKIEWSSKTGLLINGCETLLRGGCIHHDNGVLGACSFADAEYRRVKLLKEQGFNSLRISHNPASRQLLDACDQLGMYVLDECFDGWYIPKEYHDYSRVFFDEYKNDLTAMVEKDKNHPCVIMYSAGNEVTETGEEKGIKLCAEMRDYIKILDDTRPVTCGVNILLNCFTRIGMGIYKDKGSYNSKPIPEDKSYKEKKAGSAFFNAVTNKLSWLFFIISKTELAEKIARDISPSLDILGMNYASSRYDSDIRKYPDRVIVGSETMAGDLPYNWERVKKYPSLIGDFVWAAWDYLGEACIGDWTYYSYKGLPLLAGQGMIDITGKPLASMAFMRVVWGLRETPFIAVRPLNHLNETPGKGAWQFTNAIDSWSWQGYEGKKAVVEIYSDAHAIKLELNGKPAGIKKINKYRVIFHLKFTPGTLSAIALGADGTEISRSHLSTGGEKTILTVKTDKNILSENNQDLCFAEIEFTDENGGIKPYIEQRVEIEIRGESVVLQGFGSALCKTDEVFDKPYHDSYRGRCLAVFRSTSTKGTTIVIFKSRGVTPVEIQLEAR